MGRLSGDRITERLQAVTTRIPHRMDATVRGGNAGYDRGPALGDAVTSPSMSPKR